ncbi:MAG: PDZ domain-containing protein, partial [Gemmatimonadales bacterium]
MRQSARVYANGIAAVVCLAAVGAGVQRSGVQAAGGQGARSASPAWMGFGIRCGNECEMVGRAGGRSTWTFRAAPVVVEVSKGGPAEMAGLRVGDTLIALDGISLVTESGGNRLGRIEAGERVRVGYRRGYAGEANLVAARQPAGDPGEEAGLLGFSGSVAGADVEVRGAGA